MWIRDDVDAERHADTVLNGRERASLSRFFMKAADGYSNELRVVAGDGPVREIRRVFQAHPRVVSM
jgi:hypothetical protein